MTVTDLPVTTIPIVLRATAPLHHGAGTSGNTALLRTQEVLLPDARQTAVPYISGNSLRHALRDALAWRLVRVLGIPDGHLPKTAVDLLWSGGALSGASQYAELATIRDTVTAIPALGLLGYSAGSDIVSGSLRVDNAQLVCSDNSWRLPERLRGFPQASVPAGRFRGVEFGTRHDIAGSAPSRLVESGMVDTPTTQMIYEHEVLLPGSVLWTQTTLHAPTDAVTDALHVALCDVTAGGVWRVGARAASGFGACQVTIGGLDRSAPDRHDQHLRDNADMILTVLGVG